MSNRVSLVAALALAMLLGACKQDAPPSLPPTPVTPAPAPPAPPKPLAPEWHATDLPRVDVHVHVSTGGMDRALEMLQGQRVRHLVNLSGGSPGNSLEMQLAAAAATSGKVTTFTTPDWREAQAPGYGKRLAEKVALAHKLGARGVKISKGLGLGYVGPDRKLLPVDDPGLDAMFAQAGALDMPVAIHTGDPKAFWLPPVPTNERFDELQVHPSWSFYGQPLPSWAELYTQFERRVTRSARTTFIGVHFGNDPEDPDRVADMLSKHPNLFIDTAARIPEIGRQDPAKMRAFFVRFQDRILFGTDAGFGPAPDDLMLGSTGEDPPTAAEVVRFWDATWRYFESNDRGFAHPTPIQGRWTIDGIGLPRDVLAKVYAGNAERLLHLPKTK